MSTKVIHIEFDESENPSEYHDWKFYSFNCAESSYQKYIKKYSSGEGLVFLKMGLAEGLAFTLDLYNHGNLTYYLSGECPMNCPYDLIKKAGLIIWENEIDLLGPKTIEARKDDARLFIKIYNDWLNGNIYYYFIEQDGIEINSCGGIVSDDLLIEMINEDLNENDNIILKGKAVDYVSSHKLLGHKIEDTVSV